MIILYYRKGKEAKRQRYKIMTITNYSFRAISENKMNRIINKAKELNAQEIYIPYEGAMVYFTSYTNNKRTMYFMMDI